MPVPSVPQAINPTPNRLRAVLTHFPQLGCALIGLTVVVMVAVLDKDFQVKPYFSTPYISALNNRNVIVAFCLGAVFLFFDTIQKSFFAQSYNVAEMTPLDRQWFFNTKEDPALFFGDATHGEGWRKLIDAHLDLAKNFMDQAVLRLEIGTVLLFVSISLLLMSYPENIWMGRASMLLTIVYVGVLVVDHKKRTR